MPKFNLGYIRGPVGEKGPAGDPGPDAVYNSQEVLIGSWMSEPLYRRVFTGVLSAVDTDLNIGTIVNLKFPTSIHGLIFSSSERCWESIPNKNMSVYTYSNGNVNIWVEESGKAYLNGEIKIVIEYVKI